MLEGTINAKTCERDLGAKDYQCDKGKCFHEIHFQNAESDSSFGGIRSRKSVEI